MVLVGLQLLLVVCLIMTSFFFSLSETGVLSVNPGKAKRLAMTGNKRAAILVILLREREIFLRTVLFGNTASAIFSATLTSNFLFPYYGENVVLVISVFLTMVLLVVGEIFPKTYAVRNSEKVALFVAPLILVCMRLLYPVTTLINYSVLLMQYCFGIVDSQETSNIADDVKSLVELYGGGDKSPTLHYDLRMLNSVIELEDLEVSEVMTHRTKVFTLHLDDDLQEMIRQIGATPYSRMPVLEGSQNTMIGILYVRNLLVCCLNGQPLTKELIIKSCMRPWYIPDTTTLRSQLLEFRKRKRHFAVVVDEYGAFQGTITLEDVIERIVGAIYDEYDEERNLIVRVTENEYIVDGSCLLRDIDQELSLQLSCEEASTVGGLLMHVAGRLPEKGEVFKFTGASIRVVMVRQKRVSTIQIVKQVSQDESEES